MQIGIGIGPGFVPGKGWKGGAPAFDPDAANYIDRVEAADVQTLEAGVKTAINDFVVGLKDDGEWAALKASCILAGARTLDGILEPLKPDMPVPTNINFVSGDYDRKTGLKGDGATKYLNSNRNNAADPQNSKHVGVYLHDINGKLNLYAGAGSFNATGASNLYNVDITRGRGFINSSGDTGASFLPGVGFAAASRDNSSDYTIRVSGSNQVETLASEPPLNDDIYIFARNDAGSPKYHSSLRKSFYSIGEAVDLTKLDTRISAFMSAIQGAI